MISTRSAGLLIDTVVCLTLAKWETVSGRFGGYLKPASLASGFGVRLHGAKQPLLSSRQSQTTTRGFTGFFERGVGCLFRKSEAKTRLIRRASRAVECGSGAGPVRPASPELTTFASRPKTAARCARNSDDLVQKLFVSL